MSPVSGVGYKHPSQLCCSVCANQCRTKACHLFWTRITAEAHGLDKGLIILISNISWRYLQTSSNMDWGIGQYLSQNGYEFGSKLNLMLHHQGLPQVHVMSREHVHKLWWQICSLFTILWRQRCAPQQANLFKDSSIRVGDLWFSISWKPAEVLTTSSGWVQGLAGSQFLGWWLLWLSAPLV